MKIKQPVESKDICKYRNCNKKAVFVVRFVRPDNTIGSFKLCGKHSVMRIRNYSPLDKKAYIPGL